MNSTNNTIKSLDSWLKAYGYPFYLEILYIFILTPLSVLTFASNLVTYMVLRKKQFMTSEFFRYLRLYVLNGCIISLIIITAFTSVTHQLFKFTNTYETIFYGCYIYFPLLSIFYFFSSLLEICVVFERLLFFLPRRFKRIKILSFKTFHILMFIISIAINIPAYFLFETAYVDIEYAKDSWFRLYFYGTTQFSNTAIGRAIRYVGYSIRDLLPLVVKVILNIMTVNQVKKHLNKIRNEKIEFALKISTNKLHNKQDTVLIKCNYISRTDKNQTYIAVIMCVFSLLEHFFYISSFSIYFFKLYESSNSLYYLALMSIILKHFSNFFILFKFNFLFRSQIKRNVKYFNSSVNCYFNW